MPMFYLHTQLFQKCALISLYQERETLTKTVTSMLKAVFHRDLMLKFNAKRSSPEGEKEIFDKTRVKVCIYGNK